jgi:hypothetical protein
MKVKVEVEGRRQLFGWSGRLNAGHGAKMILLKTCKQS